MAGLELKVTHLDENKRLVSLDELREGRAMVLDFWHTKCVKCPAALEKLNDEAEEREDVLFVACALSQGEGNMDAVEDLTQDWTNLTHAFMEADVKEEAKKAFGFAAVPFYVVVNKEGTILGAGDPKKIDYEVLLNAPAPEIAEIAEKAMPATEEETKPATENVFTLDEDF
jgi:thiol-disulfide isomerase/thioredoxin